MATKHVSVQTYLIIFFALMVLSALTVYTAEIPAESIHPTYGEYLHAPIAMLIAIGKAILVVLYFMHVIHSNRLTKMVIICSVFMLFVLFAFLIADYHTRPWNAHYLP